MTLHGKGVRTMKQAFRIVAVVIGVAVMAAGFAQVLAEPPVIGYCASNCPQIGQCAPRDNPCYVTCNGILTLIDCNSYYYNYDCRECPS
jgi:hypothetical protein